MKMLEIRKMKTEALTKQAADLRDEIAEMKRRLHMGELQNVRIIRSKRKELARVLTVLSEQLSKESM